MASKECFTFRIQKAFLHEFWHTSTDPPLHGFIPPRSAGVQEDSRCRFLCKVGVYFFCPSVTHTFCFFTSMCLCMYTVPRAP